jgi:hypothetical protein
MGNGENRRYSSGFRVNPKPRLELGLGGPGFAFETWEACRGTHLRFSHGKMNPCSPGLSDTKVDLYSVDRNEGN